MEEEVNYATMVFKKGGRPVEEKNEDSKEPATTGPDGEAPADLPHVRLLALCLGILCVLLAASIGAIIYVCGVMNEQRANLSHVRTENEQLILERSVLEDRTEQLILERSVLENRTEQLILERSVLENRTEQLIVERSVLENRTEQLIVERRVLENRTEQLIVERRVLEDRTEQLIVERSVLEDRTEQLIVERSVLEDRTEQLIVERRVLENRTEQLIVERSVLEDRTEQLTRDRDDLNWTLRVIKTFDNFPVRDFCPDRKCQPCQSGWIPFQENCYLFYESNGWRTWGDSQTYCQSKFANLVVIDSSQEQEFISNHTEYYYDKFHGYWLGLRQNADEDWIWVDGRNDTVWYWMTREFADSGPCVMIIPLPRENHTSNWDTVNCAMWNKFICESEILVRTPVS